MSRPSPNIVKRASRLHPLTLFIYHAQKLLIVIFFSTHFNSYVASMFSHLTMKLTVAGDTTLFVGARCPTSLSNREVSDESLGGDEMRCVRLATNNVLSQVTVNLIANIHS